MTSAPSATRSPAASLARLLGCTEGQAYTVVFGLVFSTVFALAGIPAVLHAKHLTSTWPGAEPSKSRSATAPPPALTHQAAATTPPAAASRATAVSPTAGTGGGGMPGTGLSSPSTGFPAAAAPHVGPAVPAGPATGPTAGEGSAPLATAPLPAGQSGPAPDGIFSRIGPPGAPYGVATTADGTVLVTTDNGTAHGIPAPSQLLVFDSAGGLTSRIVVTGQVTGHPDGLTGVTAWGVHQAVVLDPDTRRVIAVDLASGTQRTLATVPDLAPCLTSLPGVACEPGLIDHAPFPTAVASDPRGDLYITDPAQGTVWSLPAGSSEMQIWYQAMTPDADGPTGIAALGDGSLLVSIGDSLIASAVEEGQLYSIPVQGDGSAGTPVLISTFAHGQDPGAVAARPNGLVYVVLRGPDTIVRLQLGGSSSPTATEVTDGSGVPYDGVGELSVDGNSVLAANESFSNQSARWAVLRLS